MDQVIQWLMDKPWCANPLKINIWVDHSGFPKLSNYPVAVDRQLYQRTRSVQHKQKDE